MSFASQFHIPGAYYFDAPGGTSSQPLSAGIFRPPISPSASSSVLNLAKSSGSLYSDTSAAATPASNMKRKRTYEDAARESADWAGESAGLLLDGVETPLEQNAAGPARYTLAGQIETPGGRAGGPLAGNLDDSVYSDVGYRRALGPIREHDAADSPPIRLGELGDMGAAPKTTPPPSSEGWVVFTAIGGMVGKVWEFCSGGAFKGFYAGGGRGYDLAADTAVGATQRGGGGRVWCNEHDVPTLQADDTPQPQPPLDAVPGRFPDVDSPYATVPYRDARAALEVAPRPTAKRRQVSEVGDDLRRNWVLVEPEQQQQQQAQAQRRRRTPAPAAHHHYVPRNSPGALRASPNRRISVPVSRLGGTAPTLGRRLSSRVSHAGSPSLTAREPASFAQPRSPASASRPPTFSPSRIPVATSGGAMNPFASASPPRPVSRQSTAAGAMPLSPVSPSPAAGGHNHRRNTSNASAASMSRRRTSGALDADDIEASPRLDAEAKHLAARKLAAERDTDARIESFNARLRDMIRQGKEALGTTVEVDVEGGGAGEEVEGVWMDDD